MHENTRTTNETTRQDQDTTMLEKYGLRWAVLAAWRTELTQRAVPLPQEVLNSLEVSRIKISSGCYSAGEIGCELRRIEAALTATEASSLSEQTDKWLSLLGRAMADRA
jgi:hypothetical protein